MARRSRVRSLGGVALVLLILGLLSQTALAASPHLKSGPRVTEGTNTVTISGTLAGLGQETAVVTATITGLVTTRCTNPGGQVVEAQGRQTNITGSTTIDPSTITKNGNAPFSVVATAQPAACPNPNWTAEVTAIDVESYTLTVQQGGQTTNLGPFTA